MSEDIAHPFPSERVSAQVSRGTTARQWPLDCFCLSIITIVILILFGPSLDAGGFWWTDESRHVMDGVYFRDVIRDLPFTRLYEYTTHYFAQYPALAINWYPPFFALVEAMVFSIAGTSELSARLTVMLFCLIGLSGWYFWAAPIWGRGAAIMSSLLFLTNIQVVTWTRSVMLETPAVAMMILSVIVFTSYLRWPSWKTALVSGLTLGCMLLLKQTTAMVLPALLLYALVTDSRDRLWSRHSTWGYLIVVGVLAVLALHAIKFGSLGLGATVGNIGDSVGITSSRLSWERWTLYLEAMANVYSWPILTAALIGIAVIVLGDRRQEDKLILLWIGCWYILCTLLVGAKGDSVRYTIYATLPIALLACRPISDGIHLPWLRRLSYACLGAIIVWNGFSVFKMPHPYVSGYAEAADFTIASNGGGTILFSGRHDGNFIFHIRNRDLSRNEVVLRADKILVSMAVQKSYGVKSYVRDAGDIYEILDRYGVSTVVIEDKDLVGLSELKLLKETLQSDRFRLLKKFPLRTNVPNHSGVSLHIYRYLEGKTDGTGEIVIPLPHMGREIRVRRRTNH